MNVEKKTIRKRLLSILVMLCMVIALMPATVFAADPTEAIIGTTGYKYLSSAVLKMVQGAASDNTVYLQNDVAEARGIDVYIDPKVGDVQPIIDFNGHIYTVTYKLAGAKDTKSQAVRIYPGSVKNGTPSASATLKNGTLTNGAPSAGEANHVKFLVQNWGALTIDNMVLDGRNLYDDAVYDNLTLSINNGPVLIKGANTKIIAKPGEYAFDVDNNIEEAKTPADIVVEEGEVQGRIRYDCNKLQGAPLTLTLKIKGGTFLDDSLGNGGLEVIDSVGEEKIEISGGTFSYNYKPALDKYVVPGKGYYDLKPIDGREMYRIGDLQDVNFEMNGHGTNPGTMQVVENGFITEPDRPAEKGWTFVGWYKDQDCTTIWNFATDMVTGPTDLYAKWEKKPTYSVTVEPATGGVVTPNVLEAESGESVHLLVTPDPGYELASITVTQGGVPVALDADNNFVMPRGDVVVKAAFKKSVAATTTPVKTGDNNNMILWISLLIGSIAGAALVLFVGKRRGRCK